MSWSLVSSRESTELVRAYLQRQLEYSPDWVLLGQTTAFQWYAAGCRTLQDLRRGTGGVKLSAVQKIGLQFYDGQCSMKNGTMGMTTDRFSERYQ